jgi:hypothetical protein
MWSEARASLHLALLKGEIGRDDGEIIHDRLENCPIDRVEPPELGRLRRGADRLGFVVTPAEL